MEIINSSSSFFYTYYNVTSKENVARRNYS
nr:MAG TPA: hypothetical protein [Bacteriophage sp.]DAP08433.1 MAG TPA: hypothetical protein [Bacteriophage sp.]